MRNRFSNPTGLACSFISIGLSLQYLAARIGLGAGDGRQVLAAQALAFFLLLFPRLLSGALLSFFGEKKFPLITSLGFGLFATILLTGAAGFLTADAAWPVARVTTVSGFFCFVMSVLAHWRSGEKYFSVAFTSVLAAIAIYLGWVLWSSTSHSPIFVEKIMAGWVPLDTLHHSAISAMFDVYRVSSVGIDGLTRHPYHIGSHIWFALLIHLIGERPWVFYQLGYPVIVVPFFLYTMMAFAQSVRNSYVFSMRTQNLVLAEWSVLAIALIGCLPVSVVMKTHGMNLLVINESITVALSFCFCLGVWITDMMPSPDDFLSSRIQTKIFLYAIIPAAIAIAGFAKVSLLILMPAGLFYVAGRLGAFSSRRFWIWMVAVVMLLLPLMLYLSETHPLTIDVFSFIRTEVDRSYWLFYYPIFYSWVLFYVAARLWEKNVSTFSQLMSALRERSLLDVEMVLVVAFLGELPPLLLAVPGGGAWYFCAVANALAIGLFLAWLPRFFVKAESFFAARRLGRRLTLGTAGLALVSIGCLGSAGYKCCWGFGRLVADNIELRATVIRSAGLEDVYARCHFRESLAMLAWVPGLHLDALPDYDIVSTLLRLGNMSRKDRRSTALFIPRSTKRYWRWPTDLGHQLPFLAPGLSGLAMVGGISGEIAWLPMCYGYNMLDVKRIMRENAQASPDDFCRRLGKDGFKRIVALVEKDGRIQVELVSCP